MALTFEQGAALGGSLGQLGGYVGDKMGWTAASQAKARNDKLFGAAPTPTWGDNIANGAAKLRDLAFNTSTGEAFTGSNSGGLSTAANAPVAVPAPTSAYPAGAAAPKPAGFDDAFAPQNSFRAAPGGASTAPASISPTVPAAAPAASAAAPAAPAADTGAFGGNISSADLIAVLRDPGSSDEDKKIAQAILTPRQTPDAPIAVAEGGTLVDKHGKVVFQNGSKESDMQRAFHEAVASGFKGNIVDYQQAIRPPGTNVNVSTGEKAFDKKDGEINAETFNEMQKDSRSSQNVLNTFSAMKNLLKDPKFSSGAGSGYKLALDKVVVALGGDPQLTASREVFQAAAKKLVLDSLGGKLGAGVSNSDVTFIETISPNLDQSPAGIKLLIEIQSRAAKRQQELAQLAVQYRRDHGTFDFGFQQVAKEYADAHPLFADLQVAPPPSAKPPPPVVIDGFTITPG